MINKSRIIAFVSFFLVVGSLLLLLPQFSSSAYAGTMFFPCCDTDAGDRCVPDIADCTDQGFTVCIPNAIQCTSGSGSCVCPPPPEGACCLRDGSCSEGTEEECDADGGAYQGDDTGCETAQCQQPPPQIPTLNEWGKIITMVVIGLFAVIGIFAMRRRSKVRS